MLKLKIGDDYLLLRDNIKIPFYKKNSITNSIGDHSIDFLIPNDNNGHNAKLLGFPNRPERLMRIDLSIDITLIFLTYAKQCVLNISEADDIDIKVNIYASKGSFNYLIKDKYLNDIDLGGSRSIGTDYLTAINHYTQATLGSQDDYDYTLFPVRNESLYNSSGFELAYKNAYNAVNIWFGQTLGGYDVTSTIPYPGGREMFTPFPYVGYVLKRIFEDNGYALKNNIFSYDSELKTLCMYNNYVTSKYYFEDLYLPVAYIVGATNSSSCYINVFGSIDTTQSYLIRISSVIGMTELNGGVYKVNYVSAILGVYTYELVGIDSTDYGVYSSGGVIHSVKAIKRADYEIDLINHVPKVTISDFLDALTQSFGIHFIINDNTKEVDIKKFDDIYYGKDTINISEFTDKKIKTSEINIDGFKLSFTADSGDSFYTENVKELSTNLTLKESVTSVRLLPNNSETQDVRYVENERSYYIYRYNLVSGNIGWEFYTLNLFPLISGNGELEITPAVSTLLSSEGYTGHSENTANFHPRCENKGKDPAIPDFTDNEISLRLLFYRGFQDANTSTVVSYPLGSGSVYDAKGNKIPEANIEIKWDGQYGLYENFLKTYLYWKIHILKSVECITNWNNANLLSLKDDTIIELFDNRYIFDIINYDIYIDRIEVKKTNLVLL